MLRVHVYATDVKTPLPPETSGVAVSAGAGAADVVVAAVAAVTVLAEAGELSRVESVALVMAAFFTAAGIVGEAAAAAAAAFNVGFCCATATPVAAAPSAAAACDSGLFRARIAAPAVMRRTAAWVSARQYMSLKAPHTPVHHGTSTPTVN